MNAIRVQRHLESETLSLPELKPLIGKDVDIIVVEKTNTQPPRVGKTPKPKKFDFKKHFGAGWPDKLDDGFEEAVEKWRREDMPGELPE